MILHLTRNDHNELESKITLFFEIGSPGRVTASLRRNAKIELLPSRRHPCKSVSSEKHTISGRALESALHDVIRTFPYAAFASRLMVPALAEPDIHLLSKASGSPHRRLSLCSLPVPKQFGESLWSVISLAQSPTGRTWQPAHRRILMFLFFP